MDKVRQWSLLTAVGCLAVLAAGWFLLVSPQRSHATALRAQTTTQQQSNDMLRTQVAALRAQQKDLPKEQARLAQIATKIPDNPALPSLIRSLSDAAEGAGVDLGSLAPAQPVMATAAVAAGQPATLSTASTSAASAAAPLAQIGVTLTVTGSYFNIEQFLASLENLKRAMKVTGFTLAPGQSTTAAPAAGGAAPAGPTPGSMTAAINAMVYMSPQATTTATAPLQPVAPAAPAKK